MKLKTVYLKKDELMSEAQKRMVRPDVVLDIGCGIRPQTFVRPSTHLCAEPFKQYIDYLQEKVIPATADRSFVILNTNWEGALNILPPKSVDSVFLVDVIEHINKKEALKLLKATEKVARQQILIFTPLGFLPQEHPDGKDAWGMEGGSLQEHRSGWLPEDFGEGWEVLVAKKFHTHDNLGKKHPKPYGALWAIRNLEESSQEAPPRRKAIMGLVDAAIELNNVRLIGFSTAYTKFLNQVRLALIFLLKPFGIFR